MINRKLLYLLPTLMLFSLQTGCAPALAPPAESTAPTTAEETSASAAESTAAEIIDPPVLQNYWFETWNKLESSAKSLADLPATPDPNYSYLVFYHYQSDFLSEDRELLLSIDYKIPQFSSEVTAPDACNDEINQTVMQLLQSADEYHREISKDAAYLESIKENPESATSEFALDYSITYHNGPLTNLLLDSYSYTGGAHGTRLLISQLFSTETGQLLTLTDLFGDQTDLVVEKRNQYFQQYILDNPDLFFADVLEYVSENKEIDNRFYLSENGLVFYYEPYMISPYSSGFVSVTIPYDDLPDFAV